MARIRTVKPEFWTDSVIVQLPFQARLLFIGIWNFCDDQGFLVNEPDRLRMQIFPSEPSLDLASLLDLLVACDRLEMFTAPDGEPLLRVKNFEKHQKVDNPSKPRFAGAKKRVIPASVRRAVAAKYGCDSGAKKAVECFYCGASGSITWWSKMDGTPGSWVSFSLELDHVEAESAGGEGEAKNIVLACRTCNRSKGIKEFAEMWPSLASPSESYPAEGKGRDRKVRERNGSLLPEPQAASGAKGRTILTRKAYEAAFVRRWGAMPLCNRASNGQLARFIEVVGEDAAPRVVEFYVSHPQALYVNAKHPLNLLLRDAQKLHTEWATAGPVTETEARLAERSAANVGSWAKHLKGEA